MHISDLYTGDLCSGEFLDLPIKTKSMGEIKWLIFSQVLVVIATSIMEDIIHDHPGLLRCKSGHVTAVRSCDVITGGHHFFLPIASHRKKATASRMVSLQGSHHQDASNDMHFDLEVT